MFLPLKSGKISKISSYEELKTSPGVINGDIKYKKGDIVETKRQYTDNSGWLQVEGSSKDDVLHKMIEAYKLFDFVVE
jgi:L-amino acid ligase C-terminal domain 2